MVSLLSEAFRKLINFLLMFERSETVSEFSVARSDYELRFFASLRMTAYDGVHMSPFAIIALVLILARAIAELWLSRLNQRHVRAHANEVPPAFRGMIDERDVSSLGRLHPGQEPVWRGRHVV